MKNRILILILFTIFGLFFSGKQTLAVETPNFESCLNPQGTIKVSYNEGVHGIAGDTSQYNGSDTVYQLDSGNLTQCLCTADGQGIQTNWWKVSSLSAEEKQTLINSGWIYVPNGALWGLEETSYFVKNSNYTCSSTGTGGAVLGASASIGEVLGLASTGGSFLPFVSAIVGLAALVFGVILNYRSSKK